MTGRLLAYLGVVVGLGISITANIISVFGPGVPCLYTRRTRTPASPKSVSTIPKCSL